eukprot:CAMPEP_0198229884 /NCGR_PEP_ID=MMETSP1445-20131203/114355_1 /TAXON_ID=36898 /ORGANISM="Pyramimonas sp., Strain CCMP2087" /LENGTH=151 /DNA_ID=CAMNT_0043910367 /DNA_START=1063 /DNA_END=1517 /DNA_ORIENTATION=+
MSETLVLRPLATVKPVGYHLSQLFLRFGDALTVSQGKWSHRSARRGVGGVGAYYLDALSVATRDPFRADVRKLVAFTPDVCPYLVQLRPGGGSLHHGMSQGVKQVQIVRFGKRGWAVHPPADQPDGGKAVSEYLQWLGVQLPVLHDFQYSC